MAKTVTKVGTTTTAGAAGGGTIVSQWDTIGSMDWLGDVLPALVLVAWLALLAGGYLILDLRSRVKKLEEKG